MFGIIYMGIGMSLVKSLIDKEFVRNQNMILAYEKELSILPKGSIKTKIIGNKSYFYLNYRDGKKVISKYIGKEENASFVKEQLERRHHIELMIKKLKQEQRQIKKLEALLWFYIMAATLLLTNQES